VIEAADEGLELLRSAAAGSDKMVYVPGPGLVLVVGQRYLEEASVEAPTEYDLDFLGSSFCDQLWEGQYGSAGNWFVSVPCVWATGHVHCEGDDVRLLSTVVRGIR
jgi:hypothetical protein